MAKAMVKKKPVQPKGRSTPKAVVKQKPSQPLAITPAVIEQVGTILRLYGIDKPFVLLEAGNDRWVVQLYGENKPRVLTMQGDKPELN